MWTNAASSTMPTSVKHALSGSLSKQNTYCGAPTSTDDVNSWKETTCTKCLERGSQLGSIAAKLQLDKLRGLVKKQSISDFPHKCTHCGGPAYIGAFKFECKNNKCHERKS